MAAADLYLHYGAGGIVLLNILRNGGENELGGYGLRAAVYLFPFSAGVEFHFGAVVEDDIVFIASECLGFDFYVVHSCLEVVGEGGACLLWKVVGVTADAFAGACQAYT